MKFNLKAAAICTVVATTLVTMPAAQAQQRRILTESGTAGVTRTQGTNASGGCAGAKRFGQAGATGCIVDGENGSATGSSGAAAGVGAFRRSNRTYTDPETGNTVSGAKNSSYNAQTGEGSRNTSKSGDVNGQSYGATTQNDYNYSQESGVNGSTTVNTQNKGSYDCTYASGSDKTCTQY